MDDIIPELERVDRGQGRDKLAGELVQLVKSRLMGLVVGIANFNADNLIWSFGRYVLHIRIIKRYCIRPEVIKADHDYCVNLITATSAIDGRRMDQLVNMTQSALISLGGDRSMVERLKGLGGGMGP